MNTHIVALSRKKQKEIDRTPPRERFAAGFWTGIYDRNCNTVQSWYGYNHFDIVYVTGYTYGLEYKGTPETSEDSWQAHMVKLGVTSHE